MKLVLVLTCAVFMSCGRSQDSQSNLDGYRDDHGSRYDGEYEVKLEENNRFPIRPDQSLTPGSLCQRASEHRYPERVRYCNRDVDSDVKAGIFVTYDRELGYQTAKMQRSQFKIDHLIPLCLGGSNEVSNLWPQHHSVYDLTDPLEPFMCERLARGQIRQADAVRLIIEIKQAPETTPQRMREIERM